MPIIIVALIAAALTGLVFLRTRFRHARREPARSCLAPNRSHGPNVLCQNPTPRGGYCSTHHDQHRRDEGAVWGVGLLGVIALAAAVWFQIQA